MEDGYELQIGTLKEGSKRTYEPYLFQTETHRATQCSLSRWESLYWVDSRTGECTGEIHLVIENKQAISPYRAPFGSFQFQTDLEQSHRKMFVEAVEGYLRAKGVLELQLTAPPSSYDERGHATMDLILRDGGYQLQLAEVSSAISITPEAYEAHLVAWEQRKLRQGRAAGLTFCIHPISELKTIYDFIAACRQNKGQSISMEWDALAEVVRQNPRALIAFSAVNGTERAGAAIVIRISRQIIYTFYYAHHHQFDSISPVVFLMEGIYDWAKVEGFLLIDLGTSTANGQPNVPLLTFKKNIGGRSFHRNTYHRTL